MHNSFEYVVDVFPFWILNLLYGNWLYHHLLKHNKTHYYSKSSYRFQHRLNKHRFYSSYRISKLTIATISIPKKLNTIADNHCCSINGLPNNSVVYNNTKIGRIITNTIMNKIDFFKLLITYLPNQSANVSCVIFK